MDSTPRFALRLPYPATPVNAPRFARAAVSLLTPYGYDFSPERVIATIHSVLRDLKDQDTPLEECATLLFNLGCLYGETLIGVRGTWRATGTTSLAGQTGFPLVIEVERQVWNPIALVFACFENLALGLHGLEQLKAAKQEKVEALTRATLAAPRVAEFGDRLKEYGRR